MEPGSGQETTADHQMLTSPVPPQTNDRMPEPKPAAGPQSNSDQAVTTGGQEATSVEQMGGGTAGGDTDEVDHTKEEAEAHISVSESGDGRSEPEERKEQEEEEEELDDEEDGLGDLEPENCTENVTVTGQRLGRSDLRSRGQGSGSGPPISRYNTVCYRKIKRGNTKQRIDEFECMSV